MYGDDASMLQANRWRVNLQWQYRTLHAVKTRIKPQVNWTDLTRMTQPSSINEELVLMYTLWHIDNCKHLRVAAKHQHHALYCPAEKKTLELN